MVFIVPSKRISRSKRLTRYKIYETSPDGLFCLQVRKSSIVQNIKSKTKKGKQNPHRPMNRILTTGDNPHYEVAYSQDEEDLRKVEWHYIVHVLPGLIPPSLSEKDRMQWMLAHFTQLAVEKGNTEELEDDNDSAYEDDVYHDQEVLSQQRKEKENSFKDRSQSMDEEGSVSMQVNENHFRSNTTHSTAPTSEEEGSHDPRKVSASNSIESNPQSPLLQTHKSLNSSQILSSSLGSSEAQQSQLLRPRSNSHPELAIIQQRKLSQGSLVEGQVSDSRSRNSHGPYDPDDDSNHVVLNGQDFNPGKERPATARSDEDEEETEELVMGIPTVATKGSIIVQAQSTTMPPKGYAPTPVLQTGASAHQLSATDPQRKGLFKRALNNIGRTAKKVARVGRHSTNLEGTIPVPSLVPTAAAISPVKGVSAPASSAAASPAPTSTTPVKNAAPGTTAPSGGAPASGSAAAIAAAAAAGGTRKDSVSKASAAVVAAVAAKKAGAIDPPAIPSKKPLVSSPPPAAGTGPTSPAAATATVAASSSNSGNAMTSGTTSAAAAEYVSSSSSSSSLQRAAPVARHVSGSFAAASSSSSSSSAKGSSKGEFSADIFTGQFQTATLAFDTKSVHSCLLAQAVASVFILLCRNVNAHCFFLCLLLLNTTIFCLLGRGFPCKLRVVLDFNLNPQTSGVSGVTFASLSSSSFGGASASSLEPSSTLTREVSRSTTSRDQRTARSMSRRADQLSGMPPAAVTSQQLADVPPQDHAAFQSVMSDYEGDIMPPAKPSLLSSSSASSQLQPVPAQVADEPTYACEMNSTTTKINFGQVDRPPNAWSAVDASNFVCRIGPNYSKNGKKAKSGPAMFDMAGCDMFSHRRKVNHLMQYIRAPANAFADQPEKMALLKKHNIPPLVVINLQLPNYPAGNPLWGKAKVDGVGYSLVMYYTLNDVGIEALRNGTPAAKLMENYMTVASGLTIGKEDVNRINDRLKIIPFLVNWEELCTGKMQRKIMVYNGKPFLTRPQHTFYEGADGKYLEIDVNVHEFSWPSRKGVFSFMDRLKEVVIDIALVIEGHSDEELPEQILGCGRLYNLDPSDAIQFDLPGWEDHEDSDEE